MIISFSMSAGSFASASLSGLTGLWAPADFFTSVGFVLSFHTHLLVVQDIIKLFFIGKLVTATDNTPAEIYTKSIIWIDGVLFAGINKA